MIGSTLQYLQKSATADGDGSILVEDGYSTCFVEIIESGGGACTVTFQGAFSNVAGATWYPVGYQKVNAVASPARAVAGISVTANTQGVYQLLDRYPLVKATISASVAETVTVRAYFVP